MAHVSSPPCSALLEEFASGAPNNTIEEPALGHASENIPTPPEWMRSSGSSAETKELSPKNLGRQVSLGFSSLPYSLPT